MPGKQRPLTDVSVEIKRARKLREQQTKAESMLWDVLRAKRLGGLKFHRQHPISPFIADFACVKRRVVVEIDGGYHDYQYDDDLGRQRFLESQGWTLIRFPNEAVLNDVNAVAIAIARHAGVKPEFGERKRVLSGKMVENKSKK